MGQSVVVSRANSVAVNTLPDFIHEDHPKFVSFLRAYYEWMARYGADGALESVKLNNDIDTALDVLLDSFRASFAKHFPKDTATDFRHFAKFLKEFYQMKGSEESFRVFFQAVFGEGATIGFPRDEVLSPSSATWFKRSYLTVDCASDSVFDKIGTEVQGQESGTTAVIYDIHRLPSGFYALFIEGASGVFSHSEPVKIDYNGVPLAGTIKPAYAVKTIVSGQDWFEGAIAIDSGVGIRCLKIVYGKIQSVTITNGGTGYAVNDHIGVTTDFQGAGFDAVVSSVGGSGQITGIQIYRHGFGFDNPNVTLTVDSIGTGAVLTPVFDDQFMKAQAFEIFMAPVYPDPLVEESMVVGSTTITFKPVAETTVEYHVSDSSMPSGNHARLHDSDYYQDYSYEIKSRADFKEYETSLRHLLHIAGMKQFGKTIKELTAPTAQQPSLFVIQ